MGQTQQNPGSSGHAVLLFCGSALWHRWENRKEIGAGVGTWGGEFKIQRSMLNCTLGSNSDFVGTKAHTVF